MDTEHNTLQTVFNPLRRGSFVSDQPEHRASFGFPGWYPDPSGEHELRYWDGTAWTSLVASGGDVAEDVKGPDGSVLYAPASTVTPPLALDTRRPPQPSTPVSVALRVVAWILGLGVSTFAGMMIGLVVAGVVSDCGPKAGNAQHCFAPALTGAFFGTVGGFIFGIAAIVAFERRSGHRVEANQMILFVVIVSVMVVLGWAATGA